MKKYLFIFILMLPIFVIAEVKAELIKPNKNIESYKVVKIQLTSLMKNNYPDEDSGIKQTWEFAHPNNQRVTGPLDRFKIMLKGDSYKMLLNHLEHKIVAVKMTDGIADYEVTVLDIEKKYYKFNWRVEKYILDGELKDCWLTTMVSQPIPLGSSI